MPLRRRLPVAVLCGLALVAGGCGDDENGKLTAAQTGAELDRICSEVSAAGTGLNGEPENDAPILKEFVPRFERAIEQVRELDVPEEQSEAHHKFVAVSERQLPVMKDAQALAEQGDRQPYRAKVGELDAFAAENEALATELGAPLCRGDG